MMRTSSVIAITLGTGLSGCAGIDDTLEPSPAKAVDATTVEGYEALSGFGVAPHRATIRAVNRFGAGVYSDPTTTFTVDGAPAEIGFDGFGYGAVVLETAGQVRISDGPTTAVLDTVVTDWAGMAMHVAFPAPTAADPVHGAAVTTGGVGADGETVWWAGPAGPAHRILAADGPILGLVAGHVDVDGVVDVVTWTASTVFLLRGRAAGGFGWGTAYTAAGMSVAGADVGDLSGDNLPDLAIAWVTQDGGGIVDVWEGDGLFQFTAAEPRRMLERPTSLDIADASDDDLNQITVLADDGSWVRYVRGAELQYIPIGPTAPTAVLLPRDARLIPTGDLDGDQADEIVAASERQEGFGRSLWLFDVKTDVAGCASGDPEAQCVTKFLPLENEVGAWATMADGNGDELSDLWLLHDDRTMYALAYNTDSVEEFGYDKLIVTTLPAYGAFGLDDLDKDGTNDLVVMGGPLWWQWNGQAFGDFEQFWKPRLFEHAVVRSGMVGPFAVLETDGDPATVEALGFTLEGGRTRLEVFQKAPGAGSFGLADLEVAAGQVPDDLAVCGADAWIAVGGEALRVDLSNPNAPRIANRTGTEVFRVECGTGPSGAEGAALEGATIRLLNQALVEVGSLPANGAADLAFGDFGSGPEVGTCATPDCTVVFWRYGAGGEAVFARGDGTGITVVDAAGVETAIGGFGDLSVEDLDGDGNLDLLGVSGTKASLHRSTGSSIAPLELYHWADGITGPLVAHDGDLDGHPDLWALDAAGTLFHTLPLTYSTGSTTATTGGDTGDTGTP